MPGKLLFIAISLLTLASLVVPACGSDFMRGSDDHDVGGVGQ